MPKMKTHKGSAKRFKVTATGKVMAKKSNLRHNLEHKSANRKRKLRQDAQLGKADSKRIRTLLPHH